MRFLAIGECMAELAPTDHDGAFQLGFAGDTFNTAWYLARLAPQVEVSYLTAIGDDALSIKMRTFMHEGGVNIRHVQTVPGKTVGLYMISLDNGERSFAYWRGQSAARALANDRAALEAAMQAADLIYFSGITLAILSPSSRENLFAALRCAKASGAEIAFDPNLRPRLWKSVGEMTDICMQGAAISDVILPSFEDESRWFGDVDPAATAERYRAAGAKSVVVKNGPDPVLFVDGAVSKEITVTPANEVIDTTAAGDSFNAGYFSRYLAGETGIKCVDGACTLSRFVVGHRGALVPIEPQQFV